MLLTFACITALTSKVEVLIFLLHVIRQAKEILNCWIESILHFLRQIVIAYCYKSNIVIGLAKLRNKLAFRTGSPA